MVHIKYFIIVCILMFSGCSGKNSKQSSMVSSFENKQNELFSSNWRRDTFGCLNYRNLDIAKEIITSNSLIGKSSKIFIQYFGVPNFEHTTSEKKTFSYFFYAKCDSNQQIILRADKGWINFDFINDTLRTCPDFYAIE